MSENFYLWINDSESNIVGFGGKKGSESEINLVLALPHVTATVLKETLQVIIFYVYLVEI